jgi:O-antigen ligase
LRFTFFKQEFTIDWQSSGMLFSALAFGCIHFSPALCSVFLALCVASGLGNILFASNSRVVLSAFAMLLAVMVLFQVCMNLVFHQGGENWQGKWMVKLPLLLSPLLLQWQWTRLRVIGWLLAISLPLCWISLSSVVHYLVNFTFYNQMVLESKPIPIYSQVYHIEFSVILGVFAFLSLLVAYLIRKGSLSLGFWLLLVVGIINSLNLHILSARTGIMAFWAAVFVSFLATRPWRYFGLAKTTVTVIMLIAGIFLVPSVRHRLANSADDMRTIVAGGDLNDKSFGRRWLAWDAALSAIKEEPLKGYGMQNVQAAMNASYAKKKNTLDEFNRIPPHNQYLEVTLQSGIFALVLMLCGLTAAMVAAFRARNIPLLAFVVAFSVALLVESLLERQSGVLVIALLLPFLANWRDFAKDA